MTDMNKLAQMMLEWETKRRELEDLENKIVAIVLDHGNTVTVGNIRATYSKGRRELDYRAPVESAALTDPIAQALIEKYTETIEGQWVPSTTKTDWKSAAKEHGIEPVVLGQKDPTVKVKVIP
jgi:hypothetical protein